MVTNAGAGEVSISDPLVTIRLLSDRGEPITLNKQDFRSGYRSMEIPPRSVVVEGVLQLTRGRSEAVEARMAAARERRQGRQPSGAPSAGCVFKNPSPEQSAGLIIDRLGFKGMSVGDAQVSDVHANFIVNRGKARAADVLELVEKIKTRVREKEGLELDLEIRVIGEQPPDD